MDKSDIFPYLVMCAGVVFFLFCIGYSTFNSDPLAGFAMFFGVLIGVPLVILGFVLKRSRLWGYGIIAVVSLLVFSYSLVGGFRNISSFEAEQEHVCTNYALPAYESFHFVSEADCYARYPNWSFNVSVLAWSFICMLLGGALYTYHWRKQSGLKSL